MKLELISFNICPFVQRSVITLEYKKVPYKITYIDLESPPLWFEKISPMGKVPVLIVDEGVPLFESAVINEFIGESYGLPLHSTDLLQKARERAWIEYGSELLGEMYQMTMATDNQDMQEFKIEFFENLSKLEDHISHDGPYFRGHEFSLIDAAFAPMFMRIFLSETLMQETAWKKMPNVLRWGKNLMEVPAVQNSVIKEFNEVYTTFCDKKGSLLYNKKL